MKKYFNMIKEIKKDNWMRINVKVFIQSTLSPCARDAATDMYEEAKKNIENNYKDVDINLMFRSISSAEARERGIHQVGTLLIEGKVILKGYYRKYDVERELKRYIDAKIDA
jgi:hypothetical protein